MRHTLRQMVDGDLAGVCAAASPAAQHVAKHVQDPVGSTKEGFEDLQQKQLDYELAKQNMKRTLMPVKSIIDHVEQTHGIGDDEEMGYQDPNYMDPNMPQNMQPAPGRMQQNFPAANKNVPGTGPGLAQPSGPMVGKPGMPMVKPGMPQQPGMQAPAGQPTGQTNPAAKKPAAGGPGKSAPSKAQGKGRDIKVHVAAGTPVRDARGLRQMESAVAARNMTSCMDGCGETEALVEKKSFKKATVRAGGPGSGCKGPNCGRSGGGKGTDKTHLPKKATVGKSDTSRQMLQLKAHIKNGDQKAAWKILKGIKHQFTHDEITKVSNLMTKFESAHGRDWQEENPDFKESHSDQLHAFKQVLGAMSSGNMVNAYYYGMYNVDNENYPSVNRTLSSIVKKALSRNPEAIKTMDRYYESFD